MASAEFAVSPDAVYRRAPQLFTTDG